MPNIRQYTNQETNLPISERTSEAAASAGRAIGSAYRNIGADIGGAWADLGAAYVKVEEHRELSAGIPAFAGMTDKLTREWNETIRTADPNDPTVTQRFREQKLEPMLEQFEGAFGTDRGRRWATERAGALRQQMYTTQAADEKTRAANAVSVNIDRFANNAANTVYHDPSMLDFTLGNIDASIKEFTQSAPNLDQDAANKAQTLLAQKAKEAIVKSAFRGMAEKNPDEAQRILDSGKYKDYISGDDAKMIVRYARIMRREEAAAERTRIMQERQMAQQKSDERVSEIQGSLYNENGEFRIPPNIGQLVMSDPDIKPSAKGPLLNTIRRLERDGQAERDTPGLVGDLSKRATLPDGDPNRLTIDELVGFLGANNPTGQQITQQSFNFVKSLMKSTSESEAQNNKLLESRISVGKSIINPMDLQGRMIGGAEAKTKSEEFEAEARFQYMEGLRAGKKPAELLTPGSKDYIFNEDFVSAYKKRTTGDDALGGLNQRNQGRAGPRTDLPAPTFTAEQQASFVRKVNVATKGPVWGDPDSSTFVRDHITEIRTASGKPVHVNKVAAAAFQGFLVELENSGYKIDTIGGFNKRYLQGTNRESQHSFGNAIDINAWTKNGFAQQLITDLPPNITQMAAKYGIAWGGNWDGRKDAMHFEYVGPTDGKSAPTRPALADIFGGPR